MAVAIGAALDLMTLSAEELAALDLAVETLKRSGLAVEAEELLGLREKVMTLVGGTLTDKIVFWRDRIEQGFVCSATPAIDPLVAQRIDRQLAVRRTGLMRELRERIAEVEHRVSGGTRR